MTPHELLEAFFAGERPDRIPLTIYTWLHNSVANDPAWQPLYDAGLLVTYHTAAFTGTTPDISYREETQTINGRQVTRQITSTPAGEIYAERLDGWQQKHLLCTAEDYRVMTHIVRNTELKPCYDVWLQREREVADHGVVLTFAGRTPIQTILVDYVGLENFALHLYDLEAEMLELYDALLEQFARRIEIIADGPGRYVSILENFTAETMGPKRFEQFTMPVYEKYIPILHDAGKIAGTHYDGQLSSCKDLIARSPVDLIESLTPPPEGDMTLAQARAAWPNKLFWSNISLANYQLPAGKLRRVVLDLVEQGAVDGRLLAFEVSEELPANWKESLPVVLDALRETEG